MFLSSVSTTQNVANFSRYTQDTLLLKLITKYGSTPGNVLWIHVMEVRPTKLISTPFFWTRNHIIYNKNTFHKQNIIMNTTAKDNLRLSAIQWSILIKT